MATIPPLGIDRLVRGDRVQPGTDPAARFELTTLQVYLKKCGLKGVLSHLGVTQVVPQITVQFRIVSMDQLLKRPPILLLR